uniref:Uncharacterized protein n=1 Tax=Anguilla anguilla TaxID=7936 RepID=A0A0E9X4M9_ANGAN
MASKPLLLPKSICSFANYRCFQTTASCSQFCVLHSSRPTCRRVKSKGERVGSKNLKDCQTLTMASYCLNDDRRICRAKLGLCTLTPTGTL